MKHPAIVGLLLSATIAFPAAADEHLLVGARYFREGAYDRALVEFKVSERAQSSGPAAWYVAASLVKLGRAEEAVEAFAEAARRAPANRDALLDYYRAMACYDAKLYRCAQDLLASIGERGGPRVAEYARTVGENVAQMAAVEPKPSQIDWYHRRASSAAAAGRRSAAASYLEEAMWLASRRPDRYRHDEAAALLARNDSATAQERTR